jgi:tRNA-uridine 2-sulfurtransferase
MKKKALVLYSGGLDSRLVVKILQEKGYTIEAIHFSLPFGCGCCDLGCNFNFTQKENIKLTIMDAKKEPLLGEYLKLLKNPSHGTGKGVNPCKDCKIWMFKKAKKYADENKIEVIATGEVEGQRPMSQTPTAMKIIEDKIGFKPIRPLADLGITGRTRTKQMELAKKYGISYPSPGGGCLLCEKILSKRFKLLLNRDLITEKTFGIMAIGRHFFKDDIWHIVARNSKEGRILETFDNFVEDQKGRPFIFYNKPEGKDFALELQEAYRTGSSEEERDKFKEWKI